MGSNMFKVFYGIILVSTIGVSSILLNMGSIAAIAMILNVACVVLVAMRHYMANMVGVFGALLYGTVSYKWGLYGEAGLNLLYFFPLHLFAAFAWLLKRQWDITDGCEVQTSKVKVERLTIEYWVFIAGFMVGLVFGLYSVLGWLGGNLAFIDSITTSLSIVAMYLLVNRYREQWLFWIAVNITSIVMWLLVFFQNPELNQDAIGMMLMWVVFLTNSLYGCFQWYKND